MSPSYDLLTEPWIPVSTASGGELVGLRELFVRAHELTDLAVHIPPAESGGLRILYAIAARITGLDRWHDWTDKRLAALQAGSFDQEAVAAYFDRFADRFDLFHPSRPWLQDPRLAAQCPKPAGVNKLVLDRPAGQNQVWFGHHTDTAPVAVDAADAAWYVIAQLYYGASGRCSTRVVGGHSFANTNAGPLRGAMSYHPIGRSLFETLVVGVPESPWNAPADGGCPWELPDLPDPLVPTTPRSPLESLTGPFQHAVLLTGDATGRNVTGAYLTWAARGRADRPHDAYVIRLRNKTDDTWYRAPARGDRALWQDVEALLADRPNSRRPPVLAACDDLRIADELTIRAFGFDQDGQAKDRQWFTAATPPILRWRANQDPEAAGGIEQITATAEKFARRLDVGLKDAWKEIARSGGKNASPGPWLRAGTAYYWSRAEQVFWKHVEDRDYDAYRDFLRLARQAIDHVLREQPTPRLAKAAATAYSRLSPPPRKESA